MTITEPPLTIINKFNRGEVDDLVLARDDVEKIANSAAFVENWLPIRLGGMMHAPGTKDLGSLKADGVMLPFVFSIDDTALVEVTEDCLRLWVDDALVSRPSTVDTVPALNTWSNTSGTGSTVIFSGGAQLKAADTTQASIERTVSITDTGVEHGLRIDVTRGPVRLSTADGGVAVPNFTEGLLGLARTRLCVTHAVVSF